MNITALPNSCHDKLPNALIKAAAEDFQVDEVLGFDPASDGEHLWLWLRKRDWNTRDVIELIARKLSVASREIGYSGLKDRRAVTTQWLSIPLAKLSDRGHVEHRLQEIMAAESGLECLRVCCGQKKLRPGTHRFNHFTLVLRELCGATEETNVRLQRLSAHGFPNYFGEQRFGRQGSNLARAEAMFQGRARISRFKRGLYLSAARAYLFNLVLAQRIAQGNWNQIIDGELCILDGTNSVFAHDHTDATIHQRCSAFDIHPSGPLHGRGQSLVTDHAAAIEADVLTAQIEFVRGLEQAGVSNERRSLRAVPVDLQWHWIDQQTLELSFRLRRGVYATALLSELVQVTEQV